MFQGSQRGTYDFIRSHEVCRFGFLDSQVFPSMSEGEKWRLFEVNMNSMQTQVEVEGKLDESLVR